MSTPIFAEMSFNIHSLWFQIPALILSIYIVVSILNWKLVLEIFQRPQKQNLSIAPWTLGAAFVMFVIFAIVGPALGTLATLPFKEYFPKFNEHQIIETTEHETHELPSVSTDSKKENVNENGKNESNSDASNDRKESPIIKEEASQEMSTLKAEKTKSEKLEENPNVVNNNDATTSQSKNNEELATQHLVARMLVRAKSHPHFIIVLCIFILTVVISAPVAEELIFRVVIQGAFERLAFERALSKAEKDSNLDLSLLESPDVSERQTSSVRTDLGTALLSIVPGAFIFAILHFSTPEDPTSPISVSKLFQTTFIGFLGNVVTIALGIVFLRKRYNARAVDFGMKFLLEPRGQKTKQFFREFFRGTTLFLFSMPFVYIVQNTFKTLLPGYIVDPAPIFIFALWEGFVYYRTHSYPTVIGMHVGLNFSSFLILCFMLG